MFVFGLGYSASVLAARLRALGWEVAGTGRAGIPFDDEARVRAAVGRADAVLSSAPPGDEGDPVLARYGRVLDEAGAAWIGYLSSTGVYGDAGGAWVDEDAPLALGAGRRSARAAADIQWRERFAGRARVFRLPGIYGPGRSAVERVREGRAHRIDLPEQVFSRVHVEDIAGAVLASLDGPSGAFNVADDEPCSQNAVVEEACRLLRVAPPPLVGLDEAGLSPMARGFYAENRRVANGRAKRALGWRLRFPTYREGLRRLVE